MEKIDIKLLIGGAVVAVIALWWLMQKGNAGSVGAAVGGAAVNVVTGVASGVVEGVGQAVGIPETSASQCRIDCLAGDGWAASFSCPASDFIAYSVNGTIPP